MSLTMNLSINSVDTGNSPFSNQQTLSSVTTQSFANTEYLSERTVSVGIVESNFAPAITAPGVIVLQNMDDTNFVTYGIDNAGAMIPLGQLLPGEFVPIRLATGSTLRWQADTAAVKVRVLEHEA